MQNNNFYNSWLYKDAFKVIFPGLFLIGLIGLFIDPNPKMYLSISILGLFSLIILTEHWHKRNTSLTMFAYVLIIALPLLSILNRLGVLTF